MALDKEDLALLGEFIKSEVVKIVGDAPAPPEPAERSAVVGKPDVPFDAGPEFWIHLADGEVVKSHDSSSTHLASTDGSTVQVIGRYQVGV